MKEGVAECIYAHNFKEAELNFYEKLSRFEITST
jgi:hypothetical protein